MGVEAQHAFYIFSGWWWLLSLTKRPARPPAWGCRKRRYPFSETELPALDIPGNPGFRILHPRGAPYKKRRGEDSNLRRQPRRRSGHRGRCIQPLSATSPEEKIAYILDGGNRQMTRISPWSDSIRPPAYNGSTRNPALPQ